MINGTKALMEIADSMQEEIGNITREMDILKKKQNKMLKKNHNNKNEKYF